MTLSILKSSRLVTGALVLSSGVFLAACTSLADTSSASAQTDVAAESVEVVEGTVETVSKPDDMQEMPMDEMPMEGMSKDDMSMDGMSKDEMHAECMKKHKGMVGEMADGEKMSHEGHSSEMMEKHTKCMEGKSDMGEMHESHEHMHKSDEAVTEESSDAAEAPPHAH